MYMGNFWSVFYGFVTESIISDASLRFLLWRCLMFDASLIWNWLIWLYFFQFELFVDPPISFLVVFINIFVPLSYNRPIWHDCLSDNEIVKLENFPFMNHLGTLLMNNSRIRRINPNLGGKRNNTFVFFSCACVNPHNWSIACLFLNFCCLFSCRVLTEDAHYGADEQSS
jgi:hypothetical protein